MHQTPNPALSTNFTYYFNAIISNAILQAQNPNSSAHTKIYYWKSLNVHNGSSFILITFYWSSEKQSCMFFVPQCHLKICRLLIYIFLEGNRLLPCCTTQFSYSKGKGKVKKKKSKNGQNKLGISFVASLQNNSNRDECKELHFNCSALLIQSGFWNVLLWWMSSQQPTSSDIHVGTSLLFKWNVTQATIDYKEW